MSDELKNNENITIDELLSEIQLNINVPKKHFNKFSGFHYRKVEDILEEFRSMDIVKKRKVTIKLYDSILNVGDRYYVESTAEITFNGNSISCKAYARESDGKKGMDDAQLTGSCSTYARKYALNGLLALDDGDDPDSRDNTKNTNNFDYVDVKKKIEACESRDDLNYQYKSLISIYEKNRNEIAEMCKKRSLEIGV